MSSLTTLVRSGVCLQEEAERCFLLHPSPPPLSSVSLSSQAPSSLPFNICELASSTPPLLPCLNPSSSSFVYSSLLSSSFPSLSYEYPRCDPSFTLPSSFVVSSPRSFIFHLEPSRHCSFWMRLCAARQVVVDLCGIDDSHRYLPHCSLSSFFSLRPKEEDVLLSALMKMTLSLIFGGEDNCCRNEGRGDTSEIPSTPSTACPSNTPPSSPSRSVSGDGGGGVVVGRLASLGHIAFTFDMKPTHRHAPAVEYHRSDTLAFMTTYDSMACSPPRLSLTSSSSSLPSPTASSVSSRTSSSRSSLTFSPVFTASSLPVRPSPVLCTAGGHVVLTLEAPALAMLMRRLADAAALRLGVSLKPKPVNHITVAVNRRREGGGRGGEGGGQGEGEEKKESVAGEVVIAGGGAGNGEGEGGEQGEGKSEMEEVGPPPQPSNMQAWISSLYEEVLRCWLDIQWDLVLYERIPTEPDAEHNNLHCMKEWLRVAAIATTDYVI